MFSEKHNGENPEELETVEVCETVENEKPAAEPAETETVETVESAETEEIAQTEVPAEEQLQNEAEAEQEPEEQNSKLQALLGAIKEKLSAVVQKVRMWILQKTQAEEEKVEAVPAETLEEVKVEEIVSEENENEPVVEEPTVEENVETAAGEEMAEAEETDTAQPVEADLFAEESEEPAPAKKINPLHLGLMIAGGVILLVLLVFVVLRAAGIDLKPRENNVLYKTSYTVEDEKLEKKADEVIATIGNKELTVSELQLYYINSIYSFYSQNYYYRDYMGLDLTGRNLICRQFVTVEQVDGLCDHFHVSQFFRGNIQEQIFDERILDPETLGHVLHGCLQFTVAAAQLLLQQCGVLGIGTFHSHGVEQLFFVFEHNTARSFPCYKVVWSVQVFLCKFSVQQRMKYQLYASSALLFPCCQEMPITDRTMMQMPTS